MPDLALQRRWKTPIPASLKGQWATLYTQTVDALLERYASRGPAYEMLADMAAGLYVQVRRMESTGAIRGLDALDLIIARQLKLDEGIDQEVAAAAAQRELADAGLAMKNYLLAIETLRKLIDQSQRYTEARRQEIIVTEVNLAVVETLRIVETFVEPPLFLKIALAVRAALEGNKAA